MSITLKAASKIAEYIIQRRNLLAFRDAMAADNIAGQRFTISNQQGMIADLDPSNACAVRHAAMKEAEARLKDLDRVLTNLGVDFTPPAAAEKHQQG